jgi:hypothetical protein
VPASGDALPATCLVSETTLPFGQRVHARPPVPQAASSLIRHWSPWQQPRGQLDASHPWLASRRRHRPPWQRAPRGQSPFRQHRFLAIHAPRQCFYPGPQGKAATGRGGLGRAPRTAAPAAATTPWRVRTPKSDLVQRSKPVGSIADPSGTRAVAASMDACGTVEGGAMQTLQWATGRTRPIRTCT